MQPKVKIALSIFTFVAMVLTGLAAAEQVPSTKPHGEEPLFSPNLISLSPKLIRKKDQFEMPAQERRNLDSLVLKQKPAK